MTTMKSTDGRDIDILVRWPFRSFADECGEYGCGAGRHPANMGGLIAADLDKAGALRRTRFGSDKAGTIL